MKNKILFLCALCLTAFSLSASVTQAKYQSLKSRAMGSASALAEAGDASLLSNPAMLNLIDEFQLNLIGIDVTAGQNTFDLMDAYQSMIDDIDDAGDNDSLVVEILKGYIDGTRVERDGKTYNSDGKKIGNEKLVAEISSVISFVRHNFGIGIFTAININDITLVDNPTSPFVSFDVRGNVEVPVGYSMDFGSKNQFALGTSLRYIAGAGMNGRMDANELISYNDDNEDDDYVNALIGLEEYSGYSVNFGGIYKGSTLNYALTINDLFSSLSVDRYNELTNGSVEKVNSSESLETSVDIAISNKYHDYERDGNWFEKNLFWTAELKNIFSADLDGDGEKDDNIWKKTHLGSEINVFRNPLVSFDIRAGINQGYFAFGFGAEFFSLLNLEYANYTRELGPHLGMKEERVHSLGFNVRI